MKTREKAKGTLSGDEGTFSSGYPIPVRLSDFVFFYFVNMAKFGYGSYGRIVTYSFL
jgi:hypothetical protein